jgi:hypothetical protein
LAWKKGVYPPPPNPPRHKATHTLESSDAFDEEDQLRFSVENVGALPDVGNPGRLVFLTTDGKVYVDTGTDWVA